MENQEKFCGMSSLYFKNKQFSQVSKDKGMIPGILDDLEGLFRSYYIFAFLSIAYFCKLRNIYSFLECTRAGMLQYAAKNFKLLHRHSITFKEKVYITVFGDLFLLLIRTKMTIFFFFTFLHHF